MCIRDRCGGGPRRLELVAPADGSRPLLASVRPPSTTAATLASHSSHSNEVAAPADALRTR
eukprot:2544541-Alexandrium_andersonii.AAC.1